MVMDAPKPQPNKRKGTPLKLKSDKTKLCRLWKQHPHNRNLWDISLRCDDGVSIHADRTHLALWSEYFEKLFLGSFKDSDNKEVVLEGICDKSLNTIIEGLYRGSIVLCKEGIAEVLYAADRLCFLQVVEQCEQYMTNNIDNATVVVFYKLANKHSLEKLKQVTEKYIQDQLPSVVQDEMGGSSFAALGSEDMMHFLSTCNPHWRRGTHLLDLLDTLSSAGVSHQQLIDCIDVEKCSIEQLNELRAHQAVQEGSTQFMGRIAATALKHLDYLTCISSPDFLPNFGLHLEGEGYKLAVCWHVRNWSEQSKEEGKLCSPDFVIPNKGSWSLHFYPNGRPADAKGSHLSLFIERLDSCPEEMELTFKLCLLYCDAGSHLVKETSHCFMKLNYWGWPKFMELDNFEEHRDTWVQNDTIVLAALFKP